MAAVLDTPITTNDQGIDRVLSAGLPVLLVAAGGALKRRVQNVLQKIAKAQAGKLLIVKLDLDENPESARRYHLGGPAVLSFKGGVEVARTEGLPSASALNDHLAFLLEGGPVPGTEPAPDAGGAPVEVSDGTFERDVLKSDIPVLVDFWAPWCGPCRMVAPVVEKLAAEYAGRLRVAKVNTDQNPRYASQYGVRGIPTLLLVKDGQIFDRLVGVQPEPVLREAVERALLS
ncbi:MAG: thioredoxin [Anaerolineae bacterium]|nr:thioredoxin [Anaerolineae bacterium]